MKKFLSLILAMLLMALPVLAEEADVVYVSITDGAAAYLSAMSQYGLSLAILWGVDNGGSFGYCVNDASAMNLLDPIQPGDHVKACAYTDLTAWSDLYTYFETPAVAAAAGETVPLTLLPQAVTVADVVRGCGA